jgi:hypothetical protein
LGVDDVSTWAAAKADGEMREKALRQAVDQSTASSSGAAGI